MTVRAKCIGDLGDLAALIADDLFAQLKRKEIPAIGLAQVQKAVFAWPGAPRDLKNTQRLVQLTIHKVVEKVR